MTVPPPETLAAAFDLAVRAITLDVTDKPERRDVSRSRTDQQPTRKQYQARSIAETSTVTTEDQHQINVSDLHKQLVELQTAVASLRTAPPPTRADQNQGVSRHPVDAMTDRSRSQLS
mgnify:CR=1 FL=1